MTSSSTKNSGATRTNAAWVAIYFFGILVVATLVRLAVWLVNGGAGSIGGAVAWLTEPFVYVFNKPAGLPALTVGQGRFEIGSFVALLVYAGLLAVATWFLVTEPGATIFGRSGAARSNPRRGEDR